MEERNFRRWLLGIVVLALLLRVAWLASQPVSPDDYMVGVSAINYLENGQLGPTMWNHPGLRNLLVYASLQLLGSGVLGIKGWSLLFGILTTPLLALIGRRLLKSDLAALLAAFFWAVDTLSIDFSRQGINDVYLAFFPLLAILLACRFLETRNLWWLAGSGAAFGLGIASKWSVLFQLLASGGYLLYEVRSWRDWGGFSRIIAFFATLIVLPALVYLITFLPWFGRGYSLSEWPQLQKSMYLETAHHTRYGRPITGDHDPLVWFLRPVTFEDTFFITSRPGEENRFVVLLAVTNPCIWLPTLPAVGFLLWRGARRREAGLLFLAALFVLSYLPIAAAGRAIWLNTAFAVTPYAFLAVAFLVQRVVSDRKNGRVLLAGYLGLTLLLTVPLYPLAIGEGLRIPHMDELILRYFKAIEGSDLPKGAGEVK